LSTSTVPAVQVASNASCAGGSTSPQSNSRTPALCTSITMLALLGAEPSPSMMRRGQSTIHDNGPTLMCSPTVTTRTGTRAEAAHDSTRDRSAAGSP
jgi:hypothetical protein